MDRMNRQAYKVNGEELCNLQLINVYLQTYRVNRMFTQRHIDIYSMKYCKVYVACLRADTSKSRWKHYSHWLSCVISQAVERLIQPTLCEQCIEFLERRLVQQLNSSSERAGEEVLHAFILVHTKLLAFYSRYSAYASINASPFFHWSFFSAYCSRSASTLSSSDLLALIIMAQNMYPSSVDLEDTAPEVEITTAAHTAVQFSFWPLCFCFWRTLRVLQALVLKVFTPLSPRRQIKTPTAQVGYVVESVY